jgi:hypothetical protein
VPPNNQLPAQGQAPQPFQPGAPVIPPMVSSGPIVDPDEQENASSKKTKSSPGKTNKNSTQNSLQIAEIRDGLVILADGTYRAVILAQSVNFDLMSNQEREGVESSYQQFLNSLYFPVQIMLRSYRVDLKTYMNKLNKLYEGQDNVLLSLLMEDYIGFVDYLVTNSNIMEKQFYVIVPYVPGAEPNDGLNNHKLTSILKGNKKNVVHVKEKDFDLAKEEMRQRVGTVLKMLNEMSVRSVPLNTQELIELYYNFYNPDTATVQSLASHYDLETELITKGDGEAPRADLAGM